LSNAPATSFHMCSGNSTQTARKLHANSTVCVSHLTAAIRKLSEVRDRTYHLVNIQFKNPAPALLLAGPGPPGRKESAPQLPGRKHGAPRKEGKNYRRAQNRCDKSSN